MNTLYLIIGVVGLAVGFYFWSRARQQLSPEQASRIVKRQAEQQKVQIQISGEQMEAIRSQWIKDVNRPAEITFVVEGQPVGELKVATCPYWSDTCCV